MKKFLFLTFIIAAAGMGAAHGQTFTAKVNGNKQERVRREPPVHSTRAVGAFPRTARNPIQLLNPRAPQRYYGPPSETVVEDARSYEANHHPQAGGVILFGFVW